MNKYKFILTADTHCRLDEKGPVSQETGLPLKLHKKLALLDNASTYALQNNIPTLIHLGDVFERPDPSEKLRKEVLHWVRKNIENGLRTVIIGGNHDTKNKTDFNLQTEPKIANTHLFNVITDYWVVDLDEEKQLLFTAWDRNNTIRNFKPEKGTLLFGHLEIIGAQFSNEIISKKEIHPKELKKFVHTFTGHYHKKQETDIYTYVGATDRNNFGEINNPVGFYEVTWGKELHQKFIPQDGTVYKEIEITGKEEIPTNAVEQSFVKIKAYLTKEESTTFPVYSIEKQLKDAGAWYVTVEKNITSSADLESIDKNLSESEIFEEYLERKDFSKEQKEIGRHILTQTLFKGN